MLRGLRLKATPKRLAILSLLAQENGYVSPEDIWRRLQGEFGRLGLPTVYRNLEELADGGVITKILHPNRQLYYYLCTNTEHHHHFICLSCRRVEDLDGCGLHGMDDEIATRTGGRVLSHILQVNGLCRDCVDVGGMSR
jgi:Fur family zinc uptake transcriptional regulator/Fur family ferric uptake transcriptional regulator